MRSPAEHWFVHAAGHHHSSVFNDEGAHRVPEVQLASNYRASVARLADATDDGGSRPLPVPVVRGRPSFVARLPRTEALAMMAALVNLLAWPMRAASA